MEIKLEVDGRELVMNRFVREILTSMVTCAVFNLQRAKENAESKEMIGDNWMSIELEICKQSDN